MGKLPIDNNRIKNQIRLIAIGRNNWLFAGSLRTGQRAAAVMSLIQSAKLNGHDPYAYLKDVLERLPTQKTAKSKNCYRIAGHLPNSSRYRSPDGGTSLNAFSAQSPASNICGTGFGAGINMRWLDAYIALPGLPEYPNQHQHVFVASIRQVGGICLNYPGWDNGAFWS